MAKKKNERRDARKARARTAKQAKLEAQQQALRSRRRRLHAAGLIAGLTLVVAAISYWVLDDRRLVGVSLLVGGVMFLLLALGSLGAAVKPRDRGRAGSIDFGKRG